MKILLFYSIMMIVPFVVNAQEDCLKKVGQQAVAIDSLQKSLKQKTENILQIQKSFDDSLTSLNSNYAFVIRDLQKRILDLVKETNQLNKTIKKLNKTKIKDIKNVLKEKEDSLKYLNTLISELTTKIDQINKETSLLASKKITEGQEFIKLQICDFYKNNSFDSLIVKTTIYTTKYDLKFVGDDLEAKTRIEKLNIYFDAKEILDDKFNSETSKEALISLSNIKEESFLVNSLQKQIEAYELYSDALKATLNKIAALDQKVIANSEKTQDLKLKDVLSELAWFYRNYRFSYSDYTYLSEIILELMKAKQLDANSDINYLLMKI